MPPDSSSLFAVQQYGECRTWRPDEYRPRGFDDPQRFEPEAGERQEFDDKRGACGHPVEAENKRQRGKQSAEEPVGGVDGCDDA